jgi:hypothetical protein
MAYMFQRHHVPVVKELSTKSEEAAKRRVMDTVTGNGMVLIMQMQNHEKSGSCLEEVTIRACYSNIPYFVPRNSY